MSQRESGYQRKLFDQYETPAWVTLALIPHLAARPETTGEFVRAELAKWAPIIKASGAEID